MLHFSKSDEEINSSTSWRAFSVHFYFGVNYSFKMSIAQCSLLLRMFFTSAHSTQNQTLYNESTDANPCSKPDRWHVSNYLTQRVYYVSSYYNALLCMIIDKWIVFIEMYLDYMFNKCIKCITFPSALNKDL